MYNRLSVLIGRGFARIKDLNREEGQTTVEYALVLALVVAMAVAVFGLLTPFVADFFTKLNNIIPHTM